QEKSLTPEQLQKLILDARPDERLWILLALNAALDNADIANLTWDVIDLDAGLLDYRRRKRGKVQRIVPVRPDVVELLREHRAPPAASLEDNQDLVFRTPTGLKLQRFVTSAGGKKNPIDYIAMRTVRLMIDIGLKAPMPSRRRKRDR